MPPHDYWWVIFAVPGAINQLWTLKRRIQRWWNKPHPKTPTALSFLENCPFRDRRGSFLTVLLYRIRSIPRV